MVAMLGASMPAPLAMPATTKPARSTSISLRPESVVKMPWAASAPASGAAERAATRSGIPARIGSMGNGMPISPVEQTSTSSAPTPSSSAVWLHSAAASSRPRSPVAALALPLEIRTAAARPPLALMCARLIWTGAAQARFRVKVAAVGTGWPSSVASNARSRAPEALIPAASPEATNPPGVVMLMGTPPPSAARILRVGTAPGWRTAWPGRLPP
jgi:hypothetical protein